VKHSIFDFHKEAHFKNYLDQVKKFRDFDIEKAFSVGNIAIKYYSGNSELRELMVSNQNLENRWYDSLNKGEPDYSVYNDDHFISDVFACWVVYSRKYLLSLRNKKATKSGSIVDIISNNVKKIADIGCGIGYTTKALSELFPKSFVYGTNIKNTFQYSYCEEIGNHVYEEIQPNTDLIFASEYFEHIEDPIKHLSDIVTKANPKYFIIANAFGSRSVGHFTTFKVGADNISHKKIGRLFNKALRGHGFAQVKTTLWNNRPSIWIKE